MRLLALALATVTLLGAGGCDLPIPGLAKSPAAPEAQQRDGDLQLPERTVYKPGTPPVAVPDPSGSPQRTPLAQLPELPPAPTPSVTPIPTTGPQPQCPGIVRAGVRNGLSVAPSTRSAEVTWWNVGDPMVREYRLAAVSQDLGAGMQEPWNWQAIPVGRDCSQVQASVTGLNPGTHYVFVLHAVLGNPRGGATTIPEIARSVAITIVEGDGADGAEPSEPAEDDSDANPAQ